MKTSSRLPPSVYTMGSTLKPARCGRAEDTRLKTNPASVSRSSTLHSAHSPVRGQGEAGDLLPATVGEAEGGDIAALGFDELVDEPDAALSDEDRVHALTVSAAIASTPRNLVIGSKDRCAAEAPRLLFVRESTGGSNVTTSTNTTGRRHGADGCFAGSLRRKPWKYPRKRTRRRGA